MRRLRTLIVGAGRGRAHVRSLRALPERYDVAGVVDLDAERLRRLCAEEGLAPELAYGSLGAALAAGSCDAVVVATWARTHEELVEQALAAGAHVLVEKPFTLTLASARRLLALAAQRARKIAVVQQWRYLPGQRTVRRLLRERRWGQPQVGHLLSYKARGGEYPDSPHSQLWQMTVHEVDSLLAMMGEPVAAVSGHSYRPPATAWRRESTATAELTLRSGCRVALVSTSDARINSLELRVECERGALRYRNSRSFGGAELLEAATPAERGVAAAGDRSRARPDAGPAGGGRVRRLDRRRPGAGNQRPAQPAGAGGPRRAVGVGPERPPGAGRSWRSGLS